MKRVKVEELKDGDIFIWEGKYYEVIDAGPIRLTGPSSNLCIEVKCFMAPSTGLGIGLTRYLFTQHEVLLCEREL